MQLQKERMLMEDTAIFYLSQVPTYDGTGRNCEEVVMNLYKSQLTFIFHNKSNTFMHEIYTFNI